MAWRFRPASSMRPVVALRNCVAVDANGRLIAALGPDLYALSLGESGCEVDWKFTTGEHIPGSPVIGEDGAVFAHSSDGFLHLIDANGVPARPPTRVGPALGWATPLIDESLRAWICAATGGLVRVDESGQTAARPFFRHPSRFDSTGALRGNVLYVGSEDQFLHAIDLQGERGRDRWNPVAKIGLTGWYINSAIALTEDSQIIAVSRDDQMYSFDENGGLAWSVPLNGRAIGSPVIAQNGLIVIGLTTRSDTSNLLSGRLVGVHAKTGQQAWKIDFDAPVESTPVVGEGGEIYIGDNLGKVHAVSSQGQRVWSENVGSPVRSAGSIPRAGQVVFGLDDGSLIALNCSSKSLGGAWPKLLATVANRCPSVET
jgi:outer membrane protein assembly factor BamB